MCIRDRFPGVAGGAEYVLVAAFGVMYSDDGRPLVVAAPVATLRQAAEALIAQPRGRSYAPRGAHGVPPS